MSIVISFKSPLGDFVVSIHFHNSVRKVMDPREGTLFPENTARILLSVLGYDEAWGRVQ